MAEARQYGPSMPPLPEGFQQFRSEFGKQLYGPDGYDISHEDIEGRQKAVLRNYEFFGAPVVGVVCMPRQMGNVDAMGVGMCLQTMMLALTEQGLGTCIEASVTGYPEVLRKELEIEENFEILCGLAIGWPDPVQRDNKVATGRQGLEKCVVFAEE